MSREKSRVGRKGKGKGWRLEDVGGLAGALAGPGRGVTLPAPRRRVLLVTHSLSGGGAERFAATLARHLDRDRFAVAIASATARSGYPVPGDVAVTVLGYRGLATLPGTVRRLRGLLRDRPDVVLSNVLSTNALTGAALRGLPAAERPAWVARLGNAPGVGEPRLQAAYARKVYPLAAAIVGNSAGLAAAFSERNPGLAARTRALPNPIDFATLDLLAAEALPPAAVRRPGEAVVLAVGRLVRQKRPDLLLEVLARLRGEGRAVRLWLAGEGPWRERCAERAAALGVADAASWLGFCENPFPLMRHADLFLAASDFEGLPNALIEAQGLGLAAVATRCPHGPDEVIAEGETGRLVAPGDTGGLAAAAAELLVDPALRRRFGEAAAARARALFDLRAVVPRWQELLAGAAGVGG